MRQWFDVDKDGLGRQAAQQPKGRLVGELVQNALDEPGVKTVQIRLTPVLGDGPLTEITVEDDSPDGFKDLSHAYTLFADSNKRGNPEQRGQYNFGEKLVLACCQSASIVTTTGTVLFGKQGRVQTKKTRAFGSEFKGHLDMTKEEVLEVEAYIRSLILPEHVAVTYNGERLPGRKPLHICTASLETMVADDQNIMRPRIRKTKVSIYEPLPGEIAHLYEMGLPVVETGDRWHIDIAQKVPLNRDRDNVRPGYLRTVRTMALNEMYARLNKEDANSTWVTEATNSPHCSHEAINEVLDLRFGEKRASYDPTDVEANKRFVSQGGVLVYGGMLDKQAWENAREAGAIQPAGKLCPTPKPYDNTGEGEALDVIPEEKWTEQVRNIVAYAHFLAHGLMGVSILVRVVRTTRGFLACYGGRKLDLNLQKLGHKWFADGANEEVDTLLIHEFGHEYSHDHLSEEYYDALCKLGARFKTFALEQPDELRKFARIQDPAMVSCRK